MARVGGTLASETHIKSRIGVEQVTDMSFAGGMMASAFTRDRTGQPGLRLVLAGKRTTRRAECRYEQGVPRASDG